MANPLLNPLLLVGQRGVLAGGVISANEATGQRQRVDKKARPMGARLAKSKAYPLLNPLLQTLARCCWPVLVGG
jgi:hypothetical protein